MSTKAADGRVRTFYAVIKANRKQHSVQEMFRVRGGAPNGYYDGLKRLLAERDGIDPDEVIIPPAQARERGMTSTVCFPIGNLCPEGSVIKATSIDPSVVDADGVYRHTGPARVFTSETAAIAAIKGQTEHKLVPGEVLVLIGRGPLGSGMEETYQIT